MISFKSFLEEENLDEHIVHLPDGKWRLVSKKTGKNLGTYDSEEEARKREKEVEFFKHEGGK